jgi:hypothetical protein
MTCIRIRGVVGLALLCSFLVLSRHGGFAQANGAKNNPLNLQLPVSVEWNESLNPRAQNIMAADGFKFRGGTKNFKMQFSTQAPGILGGKQFQWMPGGYQLSEFVLSRKWGSIQGFRSLRYNTRIVQPDLARTITGAGIDVPKSFLGTRLSAYFLHAAPTPEASRSKPNSLAGSEGSQVGLTLARELRKDTKVQAEWAQSQQQSNGFISDNRTGSPGRTRRGLMLRLDSTVVRTEISSSLAVRDEGLANPAAPAYGPGKQNLRLDARRKFRGHQFQYSSQSDDQRASPFLGVAVIDVREHTAGWNYAPKHLPQVSAAQTWSRQTAAGRAEQESGFRMALAKSLRRINASLSLARTMRSDLRISRPLWDRTVLSGDATVEVCKGQRLHVRYESSGMRQHTILQEVSASSLQLDTRVNVWGDKLSLTPTFDLRRQRGSLPVLSLSTARFSLSALIKVPRWIPGTDFLIHFTSNHVGSAGRPDWNRADLVMRWNFKRF